MLLVLREAVIMCYVRMKTNCLDLSWFLKVANVDIVQM